MGLSQQQHILNVCPPPPHWRSLATKIIPATPSRDVIRGAATCGIGARTHTSTQTHERWRWQRSSQQTIAAERHSNTRVLVPPPASLLSNGEYPPYSIQYSFWWAGSGCWNVIHLFFFFWGVEGCTLGLTPSRLVPAVNESGHLSQMRRKLVGVFRIGAKKGIRICVFEERPFKICF